MYVRHLYIFADIFVDLYFTISINLRNNCFELYGFDILIDSELKVLFKNKKYNQKSFLEKMPED